MCRDRIQIFPGGSCSFKMGGGRVKRKKLQDSMTHQAQIEKPREHFKTWNEMK